MNYLPEVAAPISGGGFSNIFLRPQFQQQVVPAFLRNFGNQYQGMYKCVCICDLIWPVHTI